MSTKALLLQVAFFALVALSMISPCRAATISVTNIADSGPGSLRDVLSVAADGDTIDASTITGTITLTSGELLVTNSVDIIGPGPNLLAVNGNHSSGVFHIGNHVSATI